MKATKKAASRSLVIGLMIFFVGLPGICQATAFYDFDAILEVSVTGFEGLDIIDAVGDSSFGDFECAEPGCMSMVDATGTGGANIDGQPSLTATANMAGAVSNGTIDSGVSSFASLLIGNSSGTDQLFEFDLLWDYSGSAGVNDPLGETAFVSFDAFVFFGAESPLIDFGIVGAGSGDPSLVNMIGNTVEDSFSFEVPDGGIFSLDIGLSTNGNALGTDPVELPLPVPESATMLLLGSGLIGLAGLRRRFIK